MHALDPALRDAYPLEPFAELHAAFAEMARSSCSTPALESRQRRAPPSRAGRRSPPHADPEPTPDPSATPDHRRRRSRPRRRDPGAASRARSRPCRCRSTLGHDRAVRRGRSRPRRDPRPGTRGLARALVPEVLFPELGEDGTLRLDRELGARAASSARTTSSGPRTGTTARGSTRRRRSPDRSSGTSSEVTAEDLERWPAEGYRAGDVVGRSGLEAGAEELLRGTPGWSLVAVPADGERDRPARDRDGARRRRPDHDPPGPPGRRAEAVPPYAQAATAVVDPASGDVWALASQPAFNPNSMTIGTTVGGVPLAGRPGGGIFNKAVLGAYPAGSSFKPFTLVAALQTGVVTPASTLPCPPTWQYGTSRSGTTWTTRCPASVGLAESMAFSCNTTYMPLAYEVYLADETALTDLLRDFGFGAPTGIGYLVEETGSCPTTPGWPRTGAVATPASSRSSWRSARGLPRHAAAARERLRGHRQRRALWPPRIVIHGDAPRRDDVEEVEPTVAHEIPVDRADLAYVTDTLQAVVTLPYGTGTAAFAGFGIPVAGKSGTAETGTPDPHAWFPAYAPADDPRSASPRSCPTSRSARADPTRPARPPGHGRALLRTERGRGRLACSARTRGTGSIGRRSYQPHGQRRPERATTTP